jgi:hypothetical protein
VRPSCPLDLQAGPLRIEGGHANVRFLNRSAAVGEVSAAGALSLINPEVTLGLTGRIDAQGVLRGYLTTFYGCGYDVDFRKRATP